MVSGEVALMCPFSSLLDHLVQMALLGELESFVGRQVGDASSCMCEVVYTESILIVSHSKLQLLD